MNETVYSIGYSGFPIVDTFINALVNNGVNVLIDVRSTPYSAYFEKYNKNNIEKALKQAGIYYRNYAKEFGARQEDHSFYKDGRLDFETFATSEQFRQGVEKIENSLAQGYTPCFMCAEKDPVECHRANLVTRAFFDDGYNVIHLMPEGRIKTQEDIELELKNRLNFFDCEGIQDEEKITGLAYKIQNDKIGFKEADLR